MESGTLYLILAAVFGLFMAWGIGANDVANAMGTSVGSRALSLRQAVVIAAIFEFLGAVLAGGQVTATIRKGIIDADLLAGNPELLVFGMLASLLAAGVWLMVASYFGWPVSTTHTIVGAIVGFAMVGIGFAAVQWATVGSIVASWVVSPLIAGALAFALFRSVQRLIFDARDPFRAAKRYVPMYIFLVGFIIALVTLLKGLKHIGLQLSGAQSYALAAGSGLIAMGIGALLVRRIHLKAEADRDFSFTNVERVFAVLMVFTASAMAFAHGSNDVANAIGPVAAIVGVVQSGGEVVQKSALRLFRSVQRLIFDARDPFRAAKRYVPMYIFLVGFIIALVTLLKGLKHIGLQLSGAQSYALAAGSGLIAMGIGALLVRRIHLKAEADRDFSFTNVERVFAVLMVFTASAMAFAHGSNDVANAIGPVAAIVGVVQSGGEVAQKSALPLWVLLVGAVGIVVGLATYGVRVMAVIGKGITELTPSRGFAATLAAAATVVVASGTGLPISTTQTLVGAVLGVGLARGIAAINLRVVRNIFTSWIVTLPAGAILSMAFFFALKGLLG